MAPRKRNARNSNNVQQAPITVQSDYDTDTANLTEIASAINNPPATRTNTELNLAVLQRYMSGVEQIIAIAPFAVVYIFSPESQTWEKCGMEGTLFVCQLTGPRWKVIVLNRKSLDNFVAELHSPEDVEITTEYVILQVANTAGESQIFGLWIFSDANETQSTRERVAQAIQVCATQAYAIAGQEAEMYDKSEAYGVDDTPAEHGYQPASGHPVGQPLDLLQIFGQSTQASNVQHAKPNHPYDGYGPPGMPHQGLEPQFATHPDTNFFRTSASPMPHQVYTEAAPLPSQQNALLNLFKR